MPLVHSYGHREYTPTQIDPEIRTRYHRMVSLIWLEGNLLERLELAFSQLFNFPSKHGVRRRRRVDTAGLDGHYTVAAVFEEVLRVVHDNTRLVGLGDIGEDDVDY